MLISPLHAGTQGLLVRVVALNFSGSIVAASFPEAVNPYKVQFKSYEATVQERGRLNRDYQTRASENEAPENVAMPLQYLPSEL